MPLSTPQISRAARRIIREAFDDLEQTISPLEAKDFNNTTLQNVQKAALEIENQLSARGSLRNMRRLMPLFKGLEHYAKSIEVLCNGTPYLPWIWAPIKLILKIASDYVEAFERIISAYSRIAESMTRFDTLSKALVQNLAFQETLAIFYSDILKFHREAYAFVRRSGWKTFFLSSWGRFQRRFGTLIEDLKAHEDLVDKTANAVNIAHTTKMRDELSTWRTERLQDLAKQENEEFIRQYQAIVSWLKLDDAEQQVIFDSIATEGAKHPGTCDWILKQQSLVSWMRDKPEIPFLWLEGNPGTGKSVIATHIDRFLRSSGHSQVIRHFCTHSNTPSTQYDQILRSLLIQLIRPSVDLVAHVYEEYVMENKAVTVSALDQLILTISRAVSSASSKSKYIHIIIDGLDECDAEKHDRVASLLQRLVSGIGSPSSTLCKVLLASRRSPILTKMLRKKPTVSLADEKKNIAMALRTYANQKLGVLRHRFSQLGITDGDLNDMSAKIVQRADGMFLWARLILEYLSSNILMSQDEVRHAINTLPRKLSEFYGKILSDITARFDARSVARMKSILGWIAFCKRPLSKAEFRSALHFAEHDHRANVLPPPYIFDMCAPLIQENKDTTFSFIHVSVKEYLQTPESMVILSETDARYEHALAAIRCLLDGFKVFDPSYDAYNRKLKVLSGIHGFHMHATQHWDEYLLSNFNSQHMPDLSSSLISEASALADRLNTSEDASSGVLIPSSITLDVRLQGFRQHHAIHRMLKKALLDRSVATQDRPLVRVLITHTDLNHPNDLKDLQKNYQTSLREMVSISSFSGISLDELERFKQEFRSFAFTCLLRVCPHATAGFQDEKAMLAHDLTHTQNIKCNVQGCHYPPFTSSRALKAHAAKCHTGVNKIPRATRISSTPAYEVNNKMTTYSDSSTSSKITPEEYADGSNLSKHEPIIAMQLVGSISFQDSPCSPTRLEVADGYYTGSPSRIRLDPDRNLLVIAHGSLLSMYDLQEFALINNVHNSHQVISVCIAHKGTKVATATTWGIVVWEVVGRQVSRFGSYTRDQPAVLADFARDGQVVIRYEASGCADIRNVAIDVPIKRWPIGLGVQSMAISSNGDHVAALYKDFRYEIWNVLTGTATIRCGILDPWVGFPSVVFSGDSNNVIIADGRWITVWDVNGPMVDVWRHQLRITGYVSSLAVVGSGSVVIGEQTGHIGIWNWHDDQVTGRRQAHPRAVSLVANSPLGNMFVTSGNDLETTEVCIWIATGV